MSDTNTRALEAARYAFIHKLKPYFDLPLGGLPAAMLYEAFAAAIAAYQKEQQRTLPDADE